MKDKIDEIERRLAEMADEEYKAFSEKLIPNVDKNRILGVRLPDIRTFAKEIAQAKEGTALYEASAVFLRRLPHKYVEEDHLHCAVMGEKLKGAGETLAFLEDFLPYVDNWAVCDSITIKALKKDAQAVRAAAERWTALDEDGTPRYESLGQPYKVRFGIGTLMRLFLDDDFEPEDVYLLARLRSGEYYINMALAWYYSFALVKKYEETVPVFEQRLTDRWVHNKSLQKARESLRITKERKAALNALKY